MKPAILLAIAFGPIAIGASGCEPLAPVTTASGERIESVSYEERFSLSSEAREVTFSGERLKKAVELMDRAGVIGMSGDYASSAVLDKSTLVLQVHAANHHERKLVVKNCAEPHACAFFSEAVKSGVVTKTPAVCRDAVACTKN